MSRDTVDLLGDLIADHYSGDSVQTMVPPISTLLAAQDELIKLRLKVIEQGGRLEEETKLGDKWMSERDAMEHERDALASRLEAVLKACIQRDNGYDVCRLCRHRTHMGQEIPHDDYCPLVVETHVTIATDRTNERQTCRHCGNPVPCACW